MHTFSNGSKHQTIMYSRVVIGIQHLYNSLQVIIIVTFLLQRAENLQIHPLMASSGSNNDPGDQLEMPKTPTLVLREDAHCETLQPDTEQNVCDETDGVVRVFFQELRNRERTLQDADDTPPEMGSLAPPYSSANMS